MTNKKSPNFWDKGGPGGWGEVVVVDELKIC